MNYNSLTPITVNIVSKQTNMVLGRYYCDDYELHNEYLSADVSIFTIMDLAESNLMKTSDEPLCLDRSKRDTAKIGDYLYVTKTDGSDIVPLRTNALYVGVINNISGYTITTKSILTLLDVDSVIGLQAMAPWYNWTALSGYDPTTSGFATTNPAFALMDCDTILGIIQSIEYALGQTPKLYTNMRFNSFRQWTADYQTPYASYNNFADLLPVNWAQSFQTSMNLPSYTMPRSGALPRYSPWWCNSKKLDILIDCPSAYLAFGRKDPSYMFNMLNFGHWYGQVLREPRNDTDYWYTVRKSISKEDYPACYGGLGNGSTPLSIKNLWSRLKEWYNDMHMMVVPVIYDSIDCFNKLEGGYAMSGDTLSKDKLTLAARDGNPIERINGNMSNLWDHDAKYSNEFDTWNYQKWDHFSRIFATYIDSYDTDEYTRIKRDYRYDNIYSGYESATFTPFVQPGSSNAAPTQYASIGFKIVMLEMDPGYKVSSDLFWDKQYNRLLNPAPPDPAGRFNIHSGIGRGIISQGALPRSYRLTTDGGDPQVAGYRISSAYDRFYCGDYAPNPASTNATPLYDDLRLISPDLLKWHLDIDENSIYVDSISINGEADKARYDVLVYKDTIGAISCDYKQDDHEYTMLTRNDQPMDPIIYGDNRRVFQSCLKVDDELPAAYYSDYYGSTSRLRGGWTELDGFGPAYWGGGSEQGRRYQLHPPVTNPVKPVIVSKNNLKETGVGGVSVLAKSLQPQADVPVNFEVKINNNVPSEVINKWQIRMGQSACIHMKNGILYQNLRVLGVEINKDEDFFTISIGAKSPTIINEIERRTR